MTSLAGKIAIVTGVTSGIGHALTSRLIAEGARVLGVARSAEKLTAAAVPWGDRFTPLVADLAVPAARSALMKRLREEVRSVDVVVSNAAECCYETPLRTPSETWRRMLEVNLLAGIELVQTVVPAMAAGGHVVLVSSVTARHVAHAKFGPYGLSKSAVEHFAESLRLELQSSHINVALIAPGLVETPIYDKVSGFERAREKARQEIPRWLQAEDVADAILWILDRPAHVAVSELVLLPRGQAR